MTAGKPLGGASRPDAESVRLELRVIPRASREGWGSHRGDRIVVRLTAAPTDGRANARLIRFLAREFGTPQSAVVIERGETSREKTVIIQAPSRYPAVLDPA